MGCLLVFDLWRKLNAVKGKLLSFYKIIATESGQWNKDTATWARGAPGARGLPSAHRSSDSGTAASSAGSVVITMGICSDVHPLGVLLKDRLPERGFSKAMNLESVRSSSSKSGTLNLTILDAFSKPPNGVATLWEVKRKRIH